MPKKTEIDHYTDKEALDFHIKGKSGKIEINSSKPLNN
jgi:malate dehydrogenase (oxaloacetate-decarboxylating)(NADP+)